MSFSTDPSVIATDITTRLIENATHGLSTAISKQLARVQVALRQGFVEYIEASHQRTDQVKTLLHPQEAVPLEEIYVPLSFKLGGRSHKDTDVIASLKKHGRVIISGTAGGGKSMFARHANNSMLSVFADVLPVYLELRTLNSTPRRPLLEALHDSVNTHIRQLSYELFVEEVGAGRFALILDGFDEINFQHRDQYSAEILDLVTRHSRARVLVTTRPEDDISTLSFFRVYRALPISKQQALDILFKIDYDPDIKTVFIDQVKNRLFDKHEEFLSNPLLLTMMLLTYSQRSDIPDKMYIFYQQAFEILFERHDRSKGVYTRRARAGLPINEFEGVFSHFCAFSYSEEQFIFGDNNIKEYLQRAIDYEGVDGTPEAVLRDLLESTCLLQRDGLQYSFVHRSFQEYFTAKFISRLAPDQMHDAINAVVRRANSDNVVVMLADMNRTLVEEAWVLPTLDKLVSSFGDASPKAVFGSMFTKLDISASSAGFRMDGLKFIGAQQYALDRIYSYVAREDDYERLNKAHDRFRQRVSGEPNLRAELIALTSEEALARFEGRSMYGLGGEIEVEAVSNELLCALEMDKWALAEWKAACRLKNEVEARLADKKSSLKELFATPKDRSRPPRG